jgi:ABC-2 type transport system permease protein
MIAFMFVSTTVNSIPDAISSGISSGTLEALLSTRASLTSILTGLVGYGYLWTAVKALLYLTFALALGMRVEWHAALTSVVLLALIVLAYVPFGLLASSMFIAFRTNASIPAAVMIVSGLLGGVYIPMNSSRIPEFARRLSEFVPLTPGLRALRETLLQGTPVANVMPDILMLVGFVLLLNALSLWVFAEALRYARRSGTLAQY